jgi:hypothetical protein
MFALIRQATDDKLAIWQALGLSETPPAKHLEAIARFRSASFCKVLLSFKASEALKLARSTMETNSSTNNLVFAPTAQSQSHDI